MIGHGAQREAADRDIAVLWETKEHTWQVNEDFFELPPYLQTPDLDRLGSYEEDLDARDGIGDGLWFGKSIEELREPPKRPGTPAFARFTGDAVVDVIRRERIGRDDVTDLMWVEMKAPDFGGHLWNVEGPEQADTLFETDRQIARFRGLLDRLVGRDDYVFAITADHGQQPLPDVRGGWRINSKELTDDLNETFGEGVVEVVSPVDVYVDRARLTDEDATLSDVARYIGAYTLGDNIPDGAPGADRVPRVRLDDTLFAGAFSTDFLQSLTPGEITETFGESDYDEGNFPVADRPDLEGPSVFGALP